MRNIFESTDAFEAWMRKRTDVSKRLLKKKHSQMAEGPFPFLRSTFYRWAEQWPKVCPELAERAEDVLLAVGDLHVANFGVWSDSRKRQVWGVNDFDEACELAFTSDLVRLATSAVLAAAEAKIDVEANQVCDPLLAGYRAGLRTGQPILVTERHPTLVTLTRQTQEDPKTFWKKKLRPQEQPHDRRPRAASRARGHVPRLVSTRREPDVPRAAITGWARQPGPAALHRRGDEERRARCARGQSARAVGAVLVDGTGRHALADGHAAAACDPHSGSVLPSARPWLIRQLAPDIAKIEMPQPRDKRLGLAPDLLRLMGRETANIHLGSRTNQDLAERLGSLDQNLRGGFRRRPIGWSPAFARTTRSGPNATTTDCR